MFSKGDAIKANLKLIKKMPHVVLLGGMVHQQLMTKADILRISEMGNIDTLRGQLVGTLGYHQSSLSKSLTSSQQRLSQALKQYSEPEKSE